MSDELKPEDALLIKQIVRAVAELPDRTSPDDWPEAMLVTDEELRNILDEHLRGTITMLWELRSTMMILADKLARYTGGTVLGEIARAKSQLSER